MSAIIDLLLAVPLKSLLPLFLKFDARFVLKSEQVVTAVDWILLSTAADSHIQTRHNAISGAFSQ